MQALFLVLRTSLIHGGRGWSCHIHSMVLHGASNQDKLSLCRPSFLFYVPVPSMGGGGVVVIFTSWCFQPRLALACFQYLSYPWGGGGVVIFTPWCFMVRPTKVSSHCAGPLSCFTYLSHPWGEGVRSCNIHSLVFHASPIKLL